MIRTLALRTACACLLALPPQSALAGAGDYGIEKLFVVGDPDPVAGTIQFLFGEVSIGDGRVTAWGNGSGFQSRAYEYENGVLSVGAVEGDAVPGVGGEVFSEVARSRVASPDALAYIGSFSGQSGGFLRSGGTHAAIALPAAALPAGGVIEQVPYIHTAAPGPWVALGVEVDTGAPVPIAAHLAHGPAGLREIYRDGAAAPAGIGGVFSGVEPWDEAAIATDGSVVFVAAVAGGSAASGIFRAPASGPVVPLLLQGDAVTTPGGGSFEGFAPFASVGPAGGIAFNADVLRAPAAFTREGVFVLEGAVQREIALRGDPVAGASPALPLFRGLDGSSPVVIDAIGRVAFAGRLEDAAQTQSEGAVLVHDGQELFALVREGDPVPGVPGASFAFFNEVRMDAAGRIAIHAYTDQGPSGVFLATPRPVQVPALPLPALLPLGALLAATARRRLLRRR